MPSTTTVQLTRDACVTFLQTHGLYSGHSRDSIDQLRKIVSDHEAQLARTALGDAISGEVLFPDGPERVAAAKTEHKLLKAWAKDGEKPPKPATPNLDALNEAYAAGVTAYDRMKKAKKASSSKAAVIAATPAPTPGQGYTVIRLRNGQQADEVNACLAGEQAVGVVQTHVDGLHLVVRNSEGQSVFDALVRGTKGAGIMTARRLVLAQLAVRQMVKKVTDDRNSLMARLVTALNANGADWSATGAPDSTPVFTIDGETFTTARLAAESIGVPAKAA